MKRTSEYTGIYSRKLSFLQLNCGLGVLRGRGSLLGCILLKEQRQLTDDEYRRVWWQSATLLATKLVYTHHRN